MHQSFDISFLCFFPFAMSLDDVEDDTQIRPRKRDTLSAGLNAKPL